MASYRIRSRLGIGVAAADLKAKNKIGTTTARRCDLCDWGCDLPCGSIRRVFEPPSPSNDWLRLRSPVDRRFRPGRSASTATGVVIEKRIQSRNLPLSQTTRPHNTWSGARVSAKTRRQTHNAVLHHRYGSLGNVEALEQEARNVVTKHGTKIKGTSPRRPSFTISWWPDIYRGSQGGFNRSKQHLEMEVDDGQTAWGVGHVERTAVDAVTGAPSDAARDRASVLVEDRGGPLERGSGCGVRRVRSRRQPLVPRAWRDAEHRVDRTVHEVLVVR